LVDFFLFAAALLDQLESNPLENLKTSDEGTRSWEKEVSGFISHQAAILLKERDEVN
jgi:hypothetical protein